MQEVLNTPIDELTPHDLFRMGLIARIGLEEVEALEADQEPRKYIKDQLRTLRDVYRAAVRQMLKGQKPVSLALLERNGGQ